MNLLREVFLQYAYSYINVPPILVRTVPVIPIPNAPLAIFKEY